jgi:hypothetical protein
MHANRATYTRSLEFFEWVCCGIARALYKQKEEV